jgi:nudix-type nucleoside diphosphatase (YffH/AdpP family)
VPTHNTLFLYGTLRHLPLLDIVAGERVPVRAGWLPGHLAYRVAGEDYPMIAPASGRVAEGLIVTLSDTARARLDFYELGHGYGTRTLMAETEQRAVAVTLYWPDQSVLQPAEPWDLRGWVDRDAELQCLAAAEAMTMFGRQSPQRVAERFASLRARAQARLNAREAAPTTLRRRAAPGDMQIARHVTTYADFFSVEELHFRHRTFSGGMSAPLHRAGFISADAATVLPYDPVRDRVLLIEQLRVGPILRGDPQPWSLEAIAGRIDPGETPEQAALREAREEAGLSIDRLIPLGGHYPSPGAKNEFLYSFIGLADLPDTAAGLGGLLAEGEDIRAHVIGFDQLMDLVESGEAGNGPLILSALHLARKRDELRAERDVVFTRLPRA